MSTKTNKHTKTKKKSSYRFNSQSVYLTYSQTPKKFTPQKVLKEIRAKAGVKEYLIGQERHEDGGYHIHAYFKFENKLDRDGVNLFDIKMYRNLHPNIESSIKSYYKVWRYIKKEGNYITNIDETRPKWLQLIEDTGSTHEFLTELMWSINRIDNYAGYKTLRDLHELVQWKKESIGSKDVPISKIEYLKLKKNLK